MSGLLTISQQFSAQCIPPATLLPAPPQTSTALVLKWPTSSGATQYQIRYWESAKPDDKTIVEDCGPSPFTLRGLRKNTPYTLQIRSICGSTTSDWGATINSATINSSGTCNNLPAGLNVSAETSKINVSWTSSGSHTLRYRPGDSGDWMVPAGALTLTSAPYLISGLPQGNYQVEIKRNCSATAGEYLRTIVTLGDPCTSPSAPAVTPENTSAFVDLPVVNGVLGYNVEYSIGNSGNWINAGSNIPPSFYLLNPPLSISTQYRVQIQAICSSGVSGFSPAVTFTTGQGQPVGPCLANKNAGKNLSPQEIQQIDQHLNTPSPFSFGSMIGVNDGGLVFRSFQNETSIQITQLTTQFRNFHTMDEDFDNSLVSYEQNIKPKDTNPEGTPANMGYSKGLYTRYRQIHGFTNITGATEILQYAPQSWKEKIYKESDWSTSGPAGIRGSYENYTKKFIDEMAPANGTNDQILVSNYQVGNELWDYPIKSDYHSLLLGARDAFIIKYGAKSSGGWRMKLVAGSFQAYRDNNCNVMQRDFSNCNGSLERHDFIGDYLEVTDCGLLRDLDAVDCHPYSFRSGTTSWTYPEDPTSEAWQIRNLAAWLKANQNPSTGILSNTQLWSTEYGFDSNPETGVGEKTQAAYLLRGLLIHSRYHFEKVFFYNAFDVARPTDQYYNGLYNSSGFWKMGTHPANSAWASPIEAHGATPKPAWYAMLDLKARFGEHVFHKALVEDSEAMVILIAKPDSTEPYLVFWSPQQTTDANINEKISLNKVIDWQGALAGIYKLDTTMAQTFAEGSLPGQYFDAALNIECGIGSLTSIQRNPAFIRLMPCADCPNITTPGIIVLPDVHSGGNPFDPGPINSQADANGGNGGQIEYQWQQSVNNSIFVNIPGANSAAYDPPSLTQTTYYRRAAKRSTCTDFSYTPSVMVTVVASNNCPGVTSFQRFPHIMSACNPSGDYFYEITLDQVTTNEQITLSDLPTNGINIPMCMLNAANFNQSSFFTNLQHVDNHTMKWLVNPANGSTQTLRLYYCWVNTYPDPVDVTMATTQCSGQSTPCVEGFNVTDPEIGARGNTKSTPVLAPFHFSVAPNPGTDYMRLTYEGAPVVQATLRIMTATGQSLSTQVLSALENQQQWEVNTSDLPPGIYFVCLQTEAAVRWVVWERI